MIEAACRAALAGLSGVPGSGVTAAEGAREGDRAMTLLREAVDRHGYRRLYRLRAEPAHDVLHNLPEFQAPITDLSFPAEPFGR